MKPKMMISLLVAVPLAVGCASDPNKKAKQAQAEEAEAIRAQSEKRIEETKEQTVSGAENRTDQMRERADNFPAGTEQRAKAQADFVEERQKFRADAQARLQKADARLEEARRKLQIGAGRVPTTTALDSVSRAATARDRLAVTLNGMPQVSNDQWGSTKKQMEADLDQLETLVDDATSQADKAVP
jgi:hypothetical protein